MNTPKSARARHQSLLAHARNAAVQTPGADRRGHRKVLIIMLVIASVLAHHAIAAVLAQFPMPTFFQSFVACDVKEARYGHV